MAGKQWGSTQCTFECAQSILTFASAFVSKRHITLPLRIKEDTSP